MLAATLKEQKQDGRFSQENKNWSNIFYIPEEKARRDYRVKSHPVVMDGFINRCFYPMKVNLKLFFKWGIQFKEESAVAEHGNRKVFYAEKQEIIEGIRSKYQPEWIEETKIPPNAYPMGGQQQTRTQLRTRKDNYKKE